MRQGLAAHPDPLAAAGNLVALIVAVNQPFYPLYVYWSTGRIDAWVLLTWVSTPFFLSVPLLCRCNALLGRIWLAVVGMANTLFCTWIFGSAAGVELFYLPCLVLATALFRSSERVAAFSLSGIGLLMGWGLHNRCAGPLIDYTPGQSQSLLMLNAVSVGMLLAFIGLTMPKPARPTV